MYAGTEYLRVRGPFNIAFGCRRYCLSVPDRSSLYALTWPAVCSRMLWPPVSTPDGVVHDPVHDRVGVNSGAEALVPSFLGVLGAEHR